MALALVAAVHGLLSAWAFPCPLAREPLRRKVLALTEHGRPGLIIAGDSRAQTGVIPRVVGDGLGLPPGTAVNVALHACESSATLAAYREFATRFAPKPIVVLVVSPFSVNDAVDDAAFLGDETLWSVGIVERFRLAPPRRALEACFLPERTLWRRWWRSVAERATRNAVDGGYLELSSGPAPAAAPETLGRQVEELERHWYAEGPQDGVRGALLERDLRGLLETGAQVVLFDPPLHPAFETAMAGTRATAEQERFVGRLVEVSRSLNIPLCRVELDELGDDPASLFHDLTHLNGRGATRLSERLAERLKELTRAGAIRLP
ncbi:MAG: hypothetical protein HY763_14355 [Planctomycetes bacterium]|nr:hypothetical protein [Planctomycetota bacterium]